MSNPKVIIDLGEEEEKENICEEEYIEETEDDDDDDDSSFSEEDSDWSYDDSDLECDDDDDVEIGKKVVDNDDDKVTRLLTAGSELKAVTVNECKAYLRKHGLRLSGTKAVCIERILAHWRIRDGSGQALYPRSSFAINCKGDVCKGDIVMFTQKVHHKYDKMKNSEKGVGRRTVAGKVIKESYGTAKQQHTFTIEVLWCEGIQKLPPLYPLLVKGRNLFRLMTLRQRWPNEEDRVKVLSEKHNRGAAARKVMRERKIKLGYVFKDGRLQKPGLVKKPCQVKTRRNEKDENPIQRCRQGIPTNPQQSHPSQTQWRNMNQSVHPYTSHSYVPRPRAPPSYGPPLRAPRPNIAPSHSYAYSTQQNQSNQRPPPAFYNRRPTSNALQGQSSFNQRGNTHTMYQRRPYQNHQIHRASSNSVYNYGERDLAQFANMVISHRTEGDTYRQSEVPRRPYNNHHTYHSNTNNGYNHRTEGDTRRPNHP